ncbi:MAG: hypothetical protein HRT97_06280 [Moritella sp.]|uniref:pilus assembly protein TadG-related protein n=1 Tax=Moritella sp. TaxID=78556 RepID=UPI0025DBF139|nr:pilus assembly protein TadG-related protein [Moritella sp.]NQZ91939.1 hypothetical protein [Moritella sp.]
MLNTMPSNNKKQRGFIIPLASVSLLALIAMVGFALDTGKVYSDYRLAQTAADAAALAGAFEKFNHRESTISTAANSEAATNGFTHGIDGITITINHPPTSGYYQGDLDSVEVIINQSTTTFFLPVLGIDTIDSTVRAVANGNTASSQNCVFVLDPDHEGAFEVSSDSSLVAHCGIWVNSDDDQASMVESGACVKAKSISIVGGYKTGQNCDSGGDAYQCTTGECPIYGKGKPALLSPMAATDPFFHLAEELSLLVDRAPNACPNDESCDATGCSGKEKDSGGPYEAYTVDTSGSKTLYPGTYCGGILVKKGNVTMESGVYIMRGGGFTVEGGDSDVTGNSISIYNTCYDACDGSDNGKEHYSTLDVNSSATVDLSAPPCNGGGGSSCTNALDGILFYSDPDAPSSPDPGSAPLNRIDSNVDATLSGAIYVPNQHLKFHSGSSGNPSNAILVSKFLEISSNSSVEINNFTGAGGSPLKRVTLVE